jgi:hypothetical protein
MLRRSLFPSWSRWLTSTLLTGIAATGCAWWLDPGEDAGAVPEAFPPGPLAIAIGRLPATGPGEPAAVLAGAGARAANAPCALMRWNADASQGAERTPVTREPDLAAIDAWVREVQAAGYRDLSVCLDFDGARKRDALLAPQSPVPDVDRHAELAAWVGRVVERYDADGVDDMEGLLSPVNRFRFGSHLGPGGVEPFGAFPALLARVHGEVGEASETARLVLPPLRARGEAPGALAWRIDQLVADPVPFDAWSVEASGTAEELEAWLAWLGERTPFVPIEIVDGATRPLAEAGAPTRCGSAAELAHLDARTPEADRCALAAMFVDLLARDVGTTAWVRGFVARDLAHKAIVAASRGITRAELGSAYDAEWWTDPSLEAGAGLAAWSGLLDPRSGGAYPAYYALGQLDALMRGRDTIVRERTSDPGVALFTLDGEAGPAWVGWYDPPTFVRPGHPPPVRTITIDVGVEEVWLEQLITDSGTTEALASDRVAAGGRMRLDLTPTPVFVTPDPGG